MTKKDQSPFDHKALGRIPEIREALTVSQVEAEVEA